MDTMHLSAKGTTLLAPVILSPSETTDSSLRNRTTDNPRPRHGCMFLDPGSRAFFLVEGLYLFQTVHLHSIRPQNVQLLNSSNAFFSHVLPDRVMADVCAAHLDSINHKDVPLAPHHTSHDARKTAQALPLASKTCTRRARLMSSFHLLCQHARAKKHVAHFVFRLDFLRLQEVLP